MSASSALLVIVAMCFAPTAAAETDDWFEEDDIETVPQVGAKELLFLTAPPPGNTLLSENRILIDESSLDDGWVDLEQCYRRLDAVPAVEIVFRYRNMRDLRVVRSENIGHTEPLDQSVQLSDVGHNATLCVQAEVQILYPRPDGDLELRNGPFMRKFLDGYFPMQVALEIRFPSERLDLVSIDPEPQPGFAVDAGAGLVEIDSWFVGTLNIAVRFRRVPAALSPLGPDRVDRASRVEASNSPRGFSTCAWNCPDAAAGSHAATVHYLGACRIWAIVASMVGEGGHFFDRLRRIAVAI